MDKSLAQIIKENVDRLAGVDDLNSVSLGRKSGLDQKTIYNLMHPDKAGGLPTIRTLEAISRAFKIGMWALVFPDMPVELMGDKRLADAIKRIGGCSSSSREKIFSHINDVARLDSLDRRGSEIEK